MGLDNGIGASACSHIEKLLYAMREAIREDCGPARTDQSLSRALKSEYDVLQAFRQITAQRTACAKPDPSIDKLKVMLRQLADQFTCHPASQAIDQIEQAGLLMGLAAACLETL